MLPKLRYARGVREIRGVQEVVLDVLVGAGCTWCANSVLGVPGVPGVRKWLKCVDGLSEEFY